MTNLAAALKSEIARVARKELRTEIDALRKSTSHYRSEIAALKRRLHTLEQQVKRQGKSATPPAATAAEGGDDAKLRFRVAGFAALRQKLGLSAEAMGRLIGVSNQSIYKWESGKAAPRRSQLPAIAELRKLGKREVAARLEKLEQV